MIQWWISDNESGVICQRERISGNESVRMNQWEWIRENKSVRMNHWGWISMMSQSYILLLLSYKYPLKFVTISVKHRRPINSHPPHIIVFSLCTDLSLSQTTQSHYRVWCFPSSFTQKTSMLHVLVSFIEQELCDALHSFLHTILTMRVHNVFNSLWTKRVFLLWQCIHLLVRHSEHNYLRPSSAIITSFTLLSLISTHE